MQTATDLLHRFAAGDQDAFADLVRDHDVLVRSACRRVLGPGPDVEDAVQATFIILARESSRLQETRKLSTWLYQVATHAARDWERERRARRRREGVVAAEVPLVTNDRQAQAHERVHDGLARLPASERDAIILVHLQGHTLASAALQLGRPSGTIGSWLARGRQRLREQMLRADCPAVLVGLLLGHGAPHAARVLVEIASAPPGLVSTAHPLTCPSAWPSDSLTTTSSPSLHSLTPASATALRLADRWGRHRYWELLLQRSLLIAIALVLAGLGFWAISAGPETFQPVATPAAIARAGATAPSIPGADADGGAALNVLPSGLEMILMGSMPVIATSLTPTAADRETGCPFLPPQLLKRVNRIIIGMRSTQSPEGGVILTGTGLWDQAMHDAISARCATQRWGSQDIVLDGHAVLRLTPRTGDMTVSLALEGGRPVLHLICHSEASGLPSQTDLMILALDADHLVIGTRDFLRHLHPTPDGIRQDAVRSILTLAAPKATVRIALRGVVIPGFAASRVQGLAAWLDPAGTGTGSFLHLRAPCADATTAAALQQQFAGVLPIWSHLLFMTMPQEDQAAWAPLFNAFSRAQLRADGSLLATDLSATSDYSEMMANFLKGPG